MSIIEFLRLVIRHLVLLILGPLILAGLVIILTSKPSFEYSSQTILYTGLASGSSIEMDKEFNYFATNIAFDNLINIINSRDTQEEVAIRLLSQHLMLNKADPKYISQKFFDELKIKIPKEIYSYVARNTKSTKKAVNDSLGAVNFSYLMFPPQINKDDYEKTVQNLTNLMKSSNTNFVYKLLNFEDEHYSIKTLSTVTAQRISTSDLVKLSFTVNDPGICQQTLAIYNDVCIKKYKKIKENRSDAVVKYFETQLALASEKLKEVEANLLEFNKSYKIINYYEQSKAVAVVKEEMEVDYNQKKAQLAGMQAATKRLEEKLAIQELIQQKSNKVIENKKKLGELNFDIVLAESNLEARNDEQSKAKLSELKKQYEALKNDVKKNVDKLYTYQNTIDGVPISKVLPDWMNNVVESENLKAKIKVMDQQNKDFQQQYAIYAPAGANIKRIEREISVSEQGYLEILHGLNLAKLKFQDNELSADLKTIDPPFYPLSPMPTKRKILVLATALLGVILILAIILLMEYFDNTLKNAARAKTILKLPALGMMPKIVLNSGSVNLSFVQNRLIEIITQNIQQFFSTSSTTNKTKTLLFISTQEMEGKTILAGNIAKELKNEGKKVVYLNYALKQKPTRAQSKFNYLNKYFGYQDNRIDFNNSLLLDASSYLSSSEYFKYTINNNFYTAKSYTDIINQNNITLDFVPDYVIIEFPALLYNNYPSEMVANADLNILVCRSNRLWAEADKSILNNLMPLANSKIGFIINGVALNEVESILGELPKKRSLFRKKLKDFFKFQFFTKSQI